MKSETSENGEPTLTNGDLLYKLKSNESRQDNGHALFHPEHQFTGSNLIKLMQLIQIFLCYIWSISIRNSIWDVVITIYFHMFDKIIQ